MISKFIYHCQSRRENSAKQPTTVSVAVPPDWLDKSRNIFHEILRVSTPIRLTTRNMLSRNMKIFRVSTPHKEWPKFQVGGVGRNLPLHILKMSEKNLLKTDRRDIFLAIRLARWWVVFNSPPTACVAGAIELMNVSLLAIIIIWPNDSPVENITSSSNILP